MPRHPLLLAWVLVFSSPLPGRSAEPADTPRAMFHEGREYVALSELAAFYRLDINGGDHGAWLGSLSRLLGRASAAGPMTLASPYADAVLRPDSRRLDFSGTVVWLNAPVQRVGRHWVLDRTDVEVVLDPLLRMENHLQGREIRSVVLDPGHGGEDEGGRSANGWIEKEFALDVAKRTRIHLANRGLQVFMTRENDRQIELEERCVVASERRADLFVSIHANIAANTEAKGVETFALAATGYPSTSGASNGDLDHRSERGHAHAGANMVLAYTVHKSLLGRLAAEDRGVKHARFVVLREAPCPATLVECGFLTNPEEAALLHSEDYREKIALGLADGISAYAAIAARAQADALENDLKETMADPPGAFRTGARRAGRE